MSCRFSSCFCILSLGDDLFRFVGVEGGAMLVAAAKILGGKRRAAQLAAEVRARAAAAIEENIRRRWVRRWANFIVRLEEERLGGREAPLGPHADDDSSDELAP